MLSDRGGISKPRNSPGSCNGSLVLDLPGAGEKTRLVPEPPLVPPPLLADWGAPTAIAVALIAAVGSLIATIVGQVLARRTSTELAERTTKLEQEGKERDARRD